MSSLSMSKVPARQTKPCPRRVTNTAATPTNTVVVTDPVSGPAYIIPQIEKVIAGDTPTQDATFEFTLTADSTTTPMPDGKAGGSVTANREGAGMVGFGQIEFESPAAIRFPVEDRRFDVLDVCSTPRARDDSSDHRGDGSVVSTPEK